MKNNKNNNFVLNCLFQEASKIKSLCKNKTEKGWIDKIQNLIIKIDKEVKI